MKGKQRRSKKRKEKRKDRVEVKKDVGIFLFWFENEIWNGRVERKDREGTKKMRKNTKGMKEEILVRDAGKRKNRNRKITRRNKEHEGRYETRKRKKGGGSVKEN